MATKTGEIASANERRAAIESQLALTGERIASMKERRDAAAQKTSQHVARVAGLEERHRSAAAVLERIQSLVGEMRERVYALRSQIDASAAEKVQRENENQMLAGQLVDLEAEKNASELREGLLQFESEQIRARLAEIDEALRTARLALDQARDRRGELAAAAAKLQSDAQYMAESCLNDLGMQRHELMADTTIGVVSGDQLVAEDQVYREMRTRLDNMGPVNMMALEEYKETAERHTFLETQRQDLIDSIQNTMATIKEIDTVSREKFEEAFHKINENFQLTFRKLFGGGHAFMRLTDEENSAESGIDVVGFASGKEAAERVAAFRRREGANCVIAAGWNLPICAEPVLHPGRSRCSTG